jgi:hypothetical protein
MVQGHVCACSRLAPDLNPNPAIAISARMKTGKLNPPNLHVDVLIFIHLPPNYSKGLADFFENIEREGGNHLARSNPFLLCIYNAID